MVEETRKILHDDTLRITATTVRVPVFNSHSESINVELNKPFEIDELINRLSRIGHLMELLKTKDGFPIEDLPVSISHARKELSRIFHLK